jgi:thiol-disulfide isomerase/thioredoxin
MARIQVGLLALALVACAAPVRTSSATSETPVAAPLSDYGPAPDLLGDTWLNTTGPLHLDSLKGKVVLVDMWTFDCTNCRDVVPSLRGWYEQFSLQGLVVIGNHFPEFPYERDLGRLKQALVELNIPYPVVQDNSGVNWQAFHASFWPTLYLIDKHGHIRYVRIGEGAYQETEAAIRELLDERYE